MGRFWKRLFFVLIFSQIILVVVFFKYFTGTEAASVVVRAPGDGPVLQWTVTPSGSHFAALDDNVTSPSAADTADYISVAGTGSGGAETDELLFDIPKPFDAIHKTTLWIYAKADACNGGGANKCDTLAITGTFGSLQGTVTGIAINAGSFDWIEFNLDKKGISATSLIDTLNEQATTTLKISITRQAVGAGNNNDAITIAAVYLELKTVPGQGGYGAEKKAAVSIQKTGATNKHGGDPIETITSAPAITGASITSGGENAE